MGGMEEGRRLLTARKLSPSDGEKSMLRLIAVLATIIGGFVTSEAALADGRFALLIGNKDYSPLVGSLKNPLNDIAIVGKALETTGFKTTQISNAKRVEILRNIDKFADQLANAGENAVGFFYYSGHGISKPKELTNYIIPIDITDMEKDDVWFDAVSLDSILLQFTRTAPKASIFVVFDSCRNELRTQSKGNGNKGFEPIGQTNGMFIAFSTGPNESASDRGEGSGPYAKTLSEEIVRPGQDNLTVFQNVKERVFSATKYLQRPWESNGLITRIYFAAAPVPVLPSVEEASKAWEWVKFSTDPVILKNYIDRYGNTEFGALAQAQLDKIKNAVPVQVPQTDGTKKAQPSKLVLAILSDSPIYSPGQLARIKITTASSKVKAFAVFPFGPPAQSKIEASYSITEGGLYIPFRIPAGAKPGPYSVPVYVEEMNSKLEEKQFVDFEVRG
jgi:hypothetical protein